MANEGVENAEAKLKRIGFKTAADCDGMKPLVQPPCSLHYNLPTPPYRLQLSREEQLLTSRVPCGARDIPQGGR